MSAKNLSTHSTTGKWLLSATILASAMAFIDGTALNVILPSLQQDLGAEATDLFWILNAYLLMLASFILVSGALGDKLGRKRVYMFGIGLFILASSACGLAPSVRWLVIFRGIQGLGGALMIPGSLSVISASFSGQDKGRAIGIWSAATTIVTVGGPILGGALASAGLWRMIFFINVPLGIAALLALHFKTPDSPKVSEEKRVDYPGAISLVASLAFITLGFLRVPELGWSHWQSWLSISLGSLLFGFFIFLEKRRKEPMVRLALFTNRNFAGANLLTFLLYAGLGGGMLFLTLNLIQIQGYSQLQAGLTLLPFTLMMAIIAPWAGGMVAKTGPRLFLSAGPAFAGLGFWLLSHVGLTAGPSAFWTSFLPGIGVFGLGMSLTVAPLTTTVMSSVADDYSGTASGVNNSMNRLANVFANAIIGAFAIQIFEPELMAEVQELNLPEVALQAIEREAVELGNAEVPGEVGARYQPKVESAIDQAFVATFQIILRLCAVVAWLSGLCAFLMIRNVELNKSDKD